MPTGRRPGSRRISSIVDRLRPRSRDRWTCVRRSWPRTADRQEPRPRTPKPSGGYWVRSSGASTRRSARRTGRPRARSRSTTSCGCRFLRAPAAPRSRPRRCPPDETKPRAQSPPHRRSRRCPVRDRGCPTSVRTSVRRRKRPATLPRSSRRRRRAPETQPSGRGIPTPARRSDRRSPVNASTRRSSTLDSNFQDPSAGAVHRYQTVAPSSPKNSPDSRVAPALVPSTLPLASSSTAAAARSSLAGRGPTDQFSVNGTALPA